MIVMREKVLAIVLTLLLTLVVFSSGSFGEEETKGNAALTGFKELSWSESQDPNFDHYEIYASTDPDFVPNSTNLKLTIKNRTETSAILRGLIPDKTYYILVIHVDKDGNELYRDAGSIAAKADESTLITQDDSWWSVWEPNCYLLGFIVIVTLMLVIIYKVHKLNKSIEDLKKGK